MSNDSVDTEEPLKKNTQQKYKFWNSIISAENMVFGHGNNTDATSLCLRKAAVSCLLFSILSGLIIFGKQRNPVKEFFVNYFFPRKQQKLLWKTEDQT